MSPAKDDWRGKEHRRKGKDKGSMSPGAYQRERQKSLTKRRQLCKFFEVGACEKGVHCIFAHGTEELEVPQFRDPALARLAKTKLCSFWVEGWCAQGELCPYAHGADEHRGKRGKRGGNWCQVSSNRGLTSHSAIPTPCRAARTLSRARQKGAGKGKSRSRPPRAIATPKAMCAPPMVKGRVRSRDAGPQLHRDEEWQAWESRSSYTRWSETAITRLELPPRSPSPRLRRVASRSPSSSCSRSLSPMPMLRVTGCSDEKIGEGINGAYKRCDTNHGRPVYQNAEKRKIYDAFLYYWDDRDGPELAGWWIGPKLGGIDVWVHHPKDSEVPPTTGWHTPHDGPIDTNMVVQALN